MSADIPEGQKISDKDLFNQISTFLFAGSDTTSHGITWTLYLLARHPDFQSALRRELQAVDDADAQWPEIEKLPLLDMAFRESMRCIPPVHALLRVAMQDDVIPLSEPVRLSDGRSTTSTIAIKRGQIIFRSSTSTWTATFGGPPPGNLSQSSSSFPFPSLSF